MKRVYLTNHAGILVKNCDNSLNLNYIFYDLRMNPPFLNQPCTLSGIWLLEGFLGAELLPEFNSHLEAKKMRVLYTTSK